MGEAEAAPEPNPTALNTAPALDEVSGAMRSAGGLPTASAKSAASSASSASAASVASAASAASSASSASSRTPFLSSSRMDSQACPAATCDVNRRSLAAHRSGSIWNACTGCEAIRNACTARGPVGEGGEPLVFGTAGWNACTARGPVGEGGEPLVIGTAGSIAGAVASGGGSSSACSSTRTRSPQSAKLASFL